MGLMDSLKNFILMTDEEEYEDYEESEDVEKAASSSTPMEHTEASSPSSSSRSSSMNNRRERYLAPLPQHNKGKVSPAPVSKIHVVEPKVYAEVEPIADELLGNQALIINFKNVEDVEAQRIIDFLAGIAYAVGGDLRKVRDGIFVATPPSMTIDGVLEDAEQNERFFSS